MTLFSNICLNVYSFLVLAVILHHANHFSDRKNVQNKLFIGLIQMAMVLLIVDIASRMDGRPNTIYETLNLMGNFLMFLISPVYPSLWLLYVKTQVTPNPRQFERAVKLIITVIAIHIPLVIISEMFGWLYYIDDNNIYHRGPLFAVPVLLTMVLLVYAYVIVINNRKYMSGVRFRSLMMFAVPPILGVALQYVFYGTSMVLCGVTLSMMIVYFNVQNQRMYTDYLTGVSNRELLETFCQTRIEQVGAQGAFAAILVDLDDFKQINDQFGHTVGDQALSVFAQIVKTCIGPDDLIARYGGDEFCMIINYADEAKLKAIVSQIKEKVESFNELGQYVFTLKYSLGYAIYDSVQHENALALFKAIDKRMYHDKSLRKAGLTSEANLILKKIN